MDEDPLLQAGSLSAEWPAPPAARLTLALLGAPWAYVGGEESVGLKARTAYQKAAILRSEFGQIVVIADTVPPP
jgi:hypothetical protein